MRLSTWIVGLPFAVVAVWIAVANRQQVVLSLDPFLQSSPALTFEMPLYLLLFGAFLAGVLFALITFSIRGMAVRGTQLVDAASQRAANLLPASMRKSKTPPA